MTTVRRVASEFVADLLACLRFNSRLPIPPFEFEKNPYGSEITARIRMLPFAGALIGAFGALALLSSKALGLALPLAATLAILCLIAVTGAFHEDGLADFADSTGGTTRETRLEILKDSRIGTFGTIALIGSVLLRVLSLWIFARHNLGLASLVLIATAAFRATLGLLPLVLLPPARTEGAGFSATSDQPPLARDRALRVGAELASPARRRESMGAYSTRWPAAPWQSYGSRCWRGGCTAARRGTSPAPRSRPPK